jgi:DNA-binding response OmpR family regulator
MPTILTIEDDENFRRAITKYLGKSGFEVAVASTGQEGMVKAMENPPDLIVCDLAMPGMDGFEVLAALRKEDRLASIPVIFLSGRAEPNQVREGMNYGADDYLTKPLDLADLVKAVKARLTRRQSEKERQEKQIERGMQLFSGIIHDLRDPLFAVLGFVDKLKEGTAPPVQEQGDSVQVIDQLHQVIERMQSIVSQTMFLIRSRMKRLPFDPGSFDLREFCDRVVSDHDQSQRLRFTCAAGEYPIVADSLRLRQALENLLSNGLKYSDKLVLVRLSVAVGGYLLEVMDQGIGIPAEDQASIFEPFFRASNTAFKPGHGLGLSIVKSSIDQHGGRISIVSDVNKGTTVSIELPATPPEEAVAMHSKGHSGAVQKREELAAIAGVGAGGNVEAPQSGLENKNTGNPAIGRGKCIAASCQPGFSGRVGNAGIGALSVGHMQPDGLLRAIIVDDEPMVRSVLRDFLEKSKDIKVFGEAGTVALARELARQHNPNVVFLDINLPDGLGFDLLSNLRPQTAVVFVTSAEEYAIHAFDCEATDYLLKPVSLERLQKALLRVRQHLVAEDKPGATTSSKLEETFLVKTLDEKRLVKIGDINRIIAYGEYSWVHWSKGRSAMLRKSLKQWLRELPGEQFVRVHRRAIVNLAFMERIDKISGARMQIYLRDAEEPILVSLRLSPALNRKLKAFKPESE